MKAERMHEILSLGFKHIKQPLTEDQDLALRGMCLGLQLPPPKVWMAAIDTDAGNTVVPYLNQAKAITYLQDDIKIFFPRCSTQWLMEAYSTLASTGEYRFSSNMWSIYSQEIML